MKLKSKLSLIVLMLSIFVMHITASTGTAGLPTPPIPPLPPLIVPGPPPVVPLPGGTVYLAPDVGEDLMFHHGYWYRPYGGRWYRSSHYNGPWGFVEPRKVPRPLNSLPPGYRSLPPGHQRIEHDDLKKNWRTWDRDKHWDKHGGSGKRKKHESRHEEREEAERGGHGRGHGR